MPRYRKPDKPISNYITQAGEKRLREEARYLWKEERPRVTQSVSEAAALGDRSENAEYIYGKKRLREIDSRLRYLSKRLDAVTVVDDKPQNTQKVYFGAWVILEDADGQEQQYRLVGPDEIDINQGAISIDSPLGKALLGKTAADEIAINSPSGKAYYTLLKISYET